MPLILNGEITEPFKCDFANGSSLEGRRKHIKRSLVESIALNNKFLNFAAVMKQVQLLNEDKLKQGATVETINKLSVRQEPYLKEAGSIVAEADKFILENVTEWDCFTDEAQSERLPVSADTLNLLAEDVRVALAIHLMNAGAKVDDEGKKQNGDSPDSLTIQNQESREASLIS